LRFQREGLLPLHDGPAVKLQQAMSLEVSRHAPGSRAHAQN
jgi:hypothetical protein